MRYPRLKDLREDHELMQKQVAAKLGIDQRVYSNYETGKREIPVHHLAALADLYHTSTDYLLGYDKGEERAKKKSEARFDSSKGKQVF